MQPRPRCGYTPATGIAAVFRRLASVARWFSRSHTDLVVKLLWTKAEATPIANLVETLTVRRRRTTLTTEDNVIVKSH